MLAAILFLLLSNICGSEEDKYYKIETENLPNIDVSNGLDEFDYKTNGPAVKTVDRREAAVLTYDYAEYTTLNSAIAVSSPELY